jgi:cell division protein FtsI/penicillin-binding protein 2
MKVKEDGYKFHQIHLEMANYIATAATNGAVVLWNLMKSSTQKQGSNPTKLNYKPYKRKPQN